MKNPLVYIRTFATRNSGVKALALFLAIVSWYGIRRTISFEVTASDVRVEIMPPPGFAVQHQSETGVDITFRGSQEDIRFLNVKRLVVAVDMQQIQEAGSYEISLTAEQVKGARGVRPFSVHPGSLWVELDRKEEKKIPVKPRIVGRPLSGQVENINLDPEMVSLIGPARKLQIIDHLVTAPINVDGRTESFAQRTEIAQPSDSWHAQIVPSEIRVEVAITPAPSRRQWLRQPVLALVAPRARQKIAIEPAWVDVFVVGEPATLELLDKPLVTVDCTELEPGKEYDLPVTVTVRDLNAVTEAEPGMVRVVVQQF